MREEINTLKEDMKNFKLGECKVCNCDKKIDEMESKVFKLEEHCNTIKDHSSNPSIDGKNNMTLKLSP